MDVSRAPRYTATMSGPSVPNQAQPTTTEEALVQARMAKMQAMRSRGENPFSNELAGLPLTGLGDLRAAFESARGLDGKYGADQVKQLAEGNSYHVAGRVIAARTMGKVTFLRVRDRQSELQLFCRPNALGAGYDRIGEIEVADFVDAVGTLTVTKTGELSLEPSSLKLLTKALRPLPEKWHGLVDVELRYRRRYVDLVANPDVKQIFLARSVLVRELRRFLDELGFVEVETPSMHTLVGGAAARPFHTHHNALDLSLFMRIAPELYLKRLVVGGLERVYEIGRCYRNEGISTRHNPEFTMLEFYQAYATYETLMGLTEQMLRTVDARLAAAMPEHHARWKVDRPFSLDEPFARVRMKDAVDQALARAGLGADVLSHIGKDASRIPAWAAASARARTIAWSNYHKACAKVDNAGELLFVSYEYLAEPFLAEDYRTSGGEKSIPVFIIDYPFETSPLARRKDSDPSLVDRFELFVHGRELCNAFSELNDPVDQAARFRAQVEKKARGEDETMDYDEDYVRALEHGMPPAAGFGMGVDRLVMTLTAQASIRDVILFPLLRPEK